MKQNLLLIILFLLIGLTSACSVKDKQPTIAMPDINIENVKSGNEGISNDSKVRAENKQVPTFGEKQKDQTYTDKEGSTVRVSYDAYQNKTITRYFFNDPNLKMLIITETTDGTKEGVVYGHNNEHKNLPSDLIDQAATAPGSEIASKVGIILTKRESNASVVVQNKTTTAIPKIPDPRFNPNNPPKGQQPQEVTNEAESESIKQVPNGAQEKREKDDQNQ